MALGQPRRDGGGELVEMAREKVVGVFDDNQPVFSAQLRDSFLHSLSFAEFVVGAVNEQLRLRAIRKEREIRAVHRDPDPDQFADARIAAADTKAHETPKAEAGEEQRDAWKLCSKIIERGFHIALLAASLVVVAWDEARAAKIEAQHRDAQGIQSFRRVINHLVVHGAAKERVGMAYHRCQRG